MMRWIVIAGMLWVSLQAQERYEITEKSLAYFEATSEFLMVGESTVRGENRAVEGYLDPKAMQGQIHIDTSAFETGNGMRDSSVADILGDRVLRFHVLEVAGVDETSRGKGVLRGILYLGEHRHDMMLNFAWERSPEGLRLHGEAPLAYKDVGITPPTLGMGLIKRAYKTLIIGADIHVKKSD